MSKKMDINGINFEVIKPKSWSVEKAILEFAAKDRLELHQCYINKPSSKKQAIWDKLKKWADNSRVWHLSVTSSNRYCFTVTGILEDEKGDNIGLIVITKSHNRLYLVK